MGLSVSWFALRADRPGFGRPRRNGFAFGVTDDSQVVSGGGASAKKFRQRLHRFDMDAKDFESGKNRDG